MGLDAYAIYPWSSTFEQHRLHAPVHGLRAIALMKASGLSLNPPAKKFFLQKGTFPLFSMSN